MVQALLMGLLALLNGTQGPTFWYLFREPIMAGFWVGCIYGNPTLGVQIGATIDVNYLGWISAGGANASDLYWAGLLGTFIAMTGDLSAESAAALAVPVGLLGNYAHVAYMTIASIWPTRMDSLAEKGNWKAIRKMQCYGGPVLVCLVRVLPVFFITLLGSDAINTLLNSLPVWAMHGLATVGKLLPALGMSMLFKFMYKKELLPFFFVGFAVAGYTGNADLLYYAIIGVCIALILLKLGIANEKEAA